MDRKRSNKGHSQQVENTPHFLKPLDLKSSKKRKKLDRDMMVLLGLEEEVEENNQTFSNTCADNIEGKLFENVQGQLPPINSESNSDDPMSLSLSKIRLVDQILPAAEVKRLPKEIMTEASRFEQVVNAEMKEEKREPENKSEKDIYEMTQAHEFEYEDESFEEYIEFEEQSNSSDFQDEIFNRKELDNDSMVLSELEEEVEENNQTFSNKCADNTEGKLFGNPNRQFSPINSESNSDDPMSLSLNKIRVVDQILPAAEVKRLPKEIMTEASGFEQVVNAEMKEENREPENKSERDIYEMTQAHEFESEEESIEEDIEFEKQSNSSDFQDEIFSGKELDNNLMVLLGLEEEVEENNQTFSNTCADNIEGKLFENVQGQLSPINSESNSDDPMSLSLSKIRLVDQILPAAEVKRLPKEIMTEASRFEQVVNAEMKEENGGPENESEKDIYEMTQAHEFEYEDESFEEDIELEKQSNSSDFQDEIFSGKELDNDSIVLSELEEEVEENNQTFSNKCADNIEGKLFGNPKGQLSPINSESNSDDSMSLSLNKIRVVDQILPAAEVKRLPKEIITDASGFEQVVNAEMKEENGEPENESEKDIYEMTQVHEFEYEEESIEEDIEFEKQSNSSDFQGEISKSCAKCIDTEEALKRAEVAIEVTVKMNEELESQLQEAVTQEQVLFEALQREQDEKQDLAEALQEELAEKDALAKTLQNTQNERDALSMTLQKEQNERDALSKTLQKEQNERDALSMTLQKEQNERDALAKTLQNTQNERDALAKTLQNTQNERDALSKTLQKEQNERDALSKTLQKEQNERDALSMTLQKEQNERDALAKTLQKEQNERDALSKTLQKEQNERDALSKTLQKEQNERDALSKTLQKEQNERDALSKTLQNTQNERDALSKTLQKEQNERDALSKTLQKEQNERDALSKTLQKEQNERDALSKTLQKEQNERDALSKILQKEQNERDALSKTLQKEQAAKDSLSVEMELLRAEGAELKKSQTKLQQRKAQLKGTITEMTAHLEENKKVIEKLQNNLEASASQQQQKRAEHEERNCAEIKVLRKQLNEQQKESLKKDNEIQSLHLDIQSLQSNIEAKDSTVSSLQEKIKQLALDLKEEKTKNSKLQRDYVTAISQQQEEAEKLDHLSQENRQLASENKMQPQEDGGACSRVEETMNKEKAQLAKASEMLQRQKKELSEKTRNLEKSLAAEKYLRSALKRKTKLFEQVVLQKQAAVDPLTILSNQLKEASSYSERLIYDMQTLRMENADIRAKFKATEKDYERIKSEHCSLSKRFEEMMLKKNEAISEKQCMIEELKAQQSESKRREAQLEEAVKYEKAKSSELQQKVDQVSSALENVTKDFKRMKSKNFSFSERHEEMMSRKNETISEKQCMVEELKAQQSESRRREAQLEEALKYEKAKSSELQQEVDQVSSSFENVKTEYERLKSKNFSLSERHEEMMSKKNETISEKQCMIEELKAQQSESRRREAQLEEALKYEKAKKLKLQQKVDQVSSALENVTKDYERLKSKNFSLSERHEEMMSKKNETISEKQCMVEDLKAQQSESRRREAQLEEALKYEKAKSSELQQEVHLVSSAFEKIKTDYERIKSDHCSLSGLHEEMILKKNETISEVQCVLEDLKAQQSESRRREAQLEEALKHEQSKNSELQQEVHHVCLDSENVKKDYERIKSKNCFLSERHEEMMLKKNEIISEAQCTIAKLQCIVDNLKAQESESRAREAQLEDALKHEQANNAELQQKVHQISCGFMEASSKLREAQEEKQRTESNFQKKCMSDTEFRLNHQKMALDETTKALHSLQKEYTDILKRHSDISADYRELLQAHSALKIRHERLSYAKGNPRPEFSPIHFRVPSTLDHPSIYSSFNTHPTDLNQSSYTQL